MPQTSTVFGSSLRQRERDASHHEAVQMDVK
jgi:hypothetical protein